MPELDQILQDAKLELETPPDFSFPFSPYSIQKHFMKALYEALEGRKLSIFESPTGTGKSLSIICGALAWLRDHEEREKRELSKALELIDKEQTTNDSSDWLKAQLENMAKEKVKREIRKKIVSLERTEERIRNLRSKRKSKDVKTLRDSVLDEPEDKAGNLDEDEDLLLNEVIDEGVEVSEDEEEEEQRVKIIFCSRTHSQLSQFVGEIKRTEYAADIRVVPLASRSNYCIHKTIRKMKNVSLINEKCLEMQRSKTKVTEEVDGRAVKKAKGSGCPHMKGVAELSDDILVEVKDVDGIVQLGQKTGACPYYATRASVKDAQLVVVPYNTLLHKGTRDACGITIDNNIIIIDEAHNLLETVSHIHSSTVSGHQLTLAFSQLTQYRDKYETRFSPLNLLHLNQLIHVTGSLIKLIGGRGGCGPNEATSRSPGSKLHDVAEFIATAEITNYNLYTLLDFARNSKITQKLQGYTERYQPLVQVKPRPRVSGIKAFLTDLSNKTTPVQMEVKEPVIEGQPLVHVLAFLQNLTQDYSEGRVVVCREATVGKATIKYLLLDPTSTLKDIVQKARSVIVAGGTMQPFSEFKERLFLACGAEEDRLSEFSCGHVIPSENILPIVVEAGPTGKTLDFSFQARGETPMLNEVGRVLKNVCNVVPAGIVCFFPSYEYEATVFNHLEKTGVIAGIAGKKKIFREPKKSGDVDTVLSEYAKAATSSGALLFSVVGGKLSEGLNFGDDLGRCVIVVGMPYSNIKSPELIEKMKFLDDRVGPGAGRRFYETSCMKAVNQCIGRAVRHAGDYSTVLLLDQRYSSPHVTSLLPQWISSALVVQPKFGPVLAHLVKFFKSRHV